MSEDTNTFKPICHRKPDITYPCSWEYKVIGTDKTRLTELITSACNPRQPVITFSKSSSSGKYVSLNATLVVDSEEMRLQIFNRLQDNPDVKMVI